MYKKPNYSNLGLSSPMSFELRKLVENHLLADLSYYLTYHQRIYFDWSESCIEGHDGEYLNSYLENYSGIFLFDEESNLVAEGWMDFIDDYDDENNKKFFLVYWDFLDIFQNKTRNIIKNNAGIPKHIWLKLPNNLKTKYII